MSNFRIAVLCSPSPSWWAWTDRPNARTVGAAVCFSLGSEVLTRCYNSLLFFFLFWK